MASTPIYNWPTPDNTDLVKNGALAIRTLGDAIDTTVDTMIPETIFAAKGDLLGASANDTPAVLTVGNDGETLVADSSTSTGLRYQGNFAAGKNKIINGNMLIDQRNSAASPVSVTSSVVFSVDRWSGVGAAADGVFTLGQDSSAPAGFTKSLKATITTADASIGSTQAYQIRTSLEGQSVVDFEYGLATAKTVTLSFWVRSSLTGTFGASIRNAAVNRSYPFSYSISVADTWEKKSVVIPGETTGTWSKDSENGWGLAFSMGAGTDRAGTAGAWNTNNNSGVTGQVQVISTLNATWYVTGVQAEIGNTATAFQTATGTIQGELAACQRYYIKFDAGAQYGWFCTGAYYNTTDCYGDLQLPVAMRVQPSITASTDSLTAQVAGNVRATTTAPTIQGATTNQTRIGIKAVTGADTAGRAANLLTTPSRSIELSAEL